MTKCDADCWDYLQTWEPTRTFIGVSLGLLPSGGAGAVNWLYDWEAGTYWRVEMTREQLQDLATGATDPWEA